MEKWKNKHKTQLKIKTENQKKKQKKKKMPLWLDIDRLNDIDSGIREHNSDNKSISIPMNVNPSNKKQYLQQQQQQQLYISSQQSKIEYKKEGYKILFKSGDDLRQDMLTLQILSTMNDLWLESGLDLRIRPYKVVTCDLKSGFVEIVTHSKTTNDIHVDFGGGVVDGPHDKTTHLKYLMHLHYSQFMSKQKQLIMQQQFNETGGGGSGSIGGSGGMGGMGAGMDGRRNRLGTVLMEHDSDSGIVFCLVLFLGFVFVFGVVFWWFVFWWFVFCVGKCVFFF